ncbi:MAG: phasin family protein [Pseudomonadota bacterium]
MTAKAKATPKASKTVESVVEAGKEQFEQAMKASTDAATKNFEKSFEFARKQLDEAVKGFDQVAAYSKENIEAVVASTNAATRGVEALSAEVIGLSKKGMEDGIAAVKALTSAKNARDFVDIQSTLAKDSYESFVAEASRLSEMTLKLANEVLEPVGSRFSAAVENFVRPLAR